MASIGPTILRLRKERNWSQEELAHKMGYKSKSTINKIELGINDVTQSKIVKFAEVFGVSIAHIMGWEETKSQKKNDELAMLVVKLRRDPDLQETVKDLADLTPEQRAIVKPVISALKNK